MKSIVKKVIDAEGIKIVSNPSVFRERLLSEGYSEQDAISMELIITSCPSIPALISQKEISKSEANALLSSAVKRSFLSPVIVRRLLGELFGGFNTKAPWQAIQLFGRKYEIVNEKALPGSAFEQKSVDEAALIVERYMLIGRAAVFNDAEKARLDVAISLLDKYSEEGNGYASYVLGKLCLKCKNDSNKLQDIELLSANRDREGKAFLIKAATQGFGPAYGALADLELKKENCNMPLAASYFEQPTSLEGTAGREWRKSATKLIRYREINKKKRVSTIAMLLVLIAIGIVITAVAPTSIAVPIIFLIAIPTVCLLLCLVMEKFFPYFSLRCVYTALIICWLIATVFLVR